MLPVNPPGPGNSPYSTTSAFAGSPLLVSLEHLVEDGLLDESATAGRYRADLGRRTGVPGRVDYATATRLRDAALRGAFERFRARRGWRDALERFSGEHSAWLDDYALFAALKRARRGRSWLTWDAPLRGREPSALRSAKQSADDAFDFERFVQLRFFGDWARLRRHAASRGVRLIGDIPIFVAHDSADVWGHQPLYQLRRDGRPRKVSGCPPDSFSATGQLWGHPLYDWTRHERSGFRWWIERFRISLDLFDSVRIDHFLGFHRCWEVPGAARTALHGRYALSPGRALLDAATRQLGPLPLIAEDLGAVTPEARALAAAFGFPGMRILQNGFFENARYDQPHNYPLRCVAYTGTHDNETIAGWWQTIRRDRRRGADGCTTADRFRAYTGAAGPAVHWPMLRALYASPAALVITPLQDVLGLDNRARMNTPATARGNWEWQLAPGALRPTEVARLRELARTFERLPGS